MSRRQLCHSLLCISGCTAGLTPVDCVSSDPADNHRVIGGPAVSCPHSSYSTTGRSAFDRPTAVRLGGGRISSGRPAIRITGCPTVDGSFASDPFVGCFAAERPVKNCPVTGQIVADRPAINHPDVSCIALVVPPLVVLSLGVLLPGCAVVFLPSRAKCVKLLSNTLLLLTR